jgi:DNA-binding MarR family transcriptional regulator
MYDVLAEFAEAASNDLGRLLQTAAISMNAAVLAELGAQGHPKIRPSHIAVFAGLEDEGTHISVLAARAGISRQAMGLVVREVEGLGYVQTAPDDADRRATVVRLTEQGIAFCRLAIQISAEWNREVESRLGAADGDRLRAQLREITELFSQPRDR